MNNPDLMKKILLDTNLLLYSMDANSKFYKISTPFGVVCENGAVKLSISHSGVSAFSS